MINPLEKVLLEKGIGPYQVSRETHVSSQTMYAVLNGTIKKPHRRTIGKLATYLNIDAIQLYQDYLQYKQEKDAATLK